MTERRYSLPAYCERVPNRDGTFTVSIIGESRPLGSKRVVVRYHEPADTTPRIVTKINREIDRLTVKGWSDG